MKTDEKTIAVEATKKLRIYEELKRRIIHNELMPGQYINERSFCDELGVSKTPIREALQRLEHEHFVQIIPNKGCFVSNISLDLIREVFEIREIFECAAARRAANLKDRSLFEDLLTHHPSFIVDNETDLRQTLISGYQIHELIVNSVGNTFLSSYYRAMLDHIVRIRVYFLSRFEARRLHETIDEHKELLQAIIDGDPDRAETAMRQHLYRSLSNIKDYIFNEKETWKL
ncbi:MAG: GntR family transcriptional regulator [Spirochaetales bacterium]|nr:GntR family transcriptional regulator [Spirochaetales bacterium]